MRFILIALMVFLTTGCATSYDKYHQAVDKANQRAVEIQTAKSQADAAKYAALSQIAATGDTTARVAVAMAIAFSQANQQSVQTHAPARPENEVREWAKIVVPTVGSMGLGYFQMRQGIAASEAQRDVAVSTNAAFQGMGESIGQAGVAGYQYIQSPQANTTIGGSVVGGDQVGDYSGEMSGNSGELVTGGYTSTITETEEVAAE
jgi:uncharacterized protein YceK